ncbi:MAG: hypothetical protein HYW48_06830 [Deltaproteobacteria bacterium]|nr:hypothetical protein [Deltaproteobacteria bacterium]
MVKQSKKTTHRKPLSTQNELVVVDTDFPGFLNDLEKIADSELDSVQATINKIEKMTWADVYRTSSKTPGQKRGINYEHWPSAEGYLDALPSSPLLSMKILTVYSPPNLTDISEVHRNGPQTHRISNGRHV